MARARAPGSDVQPPMEHEVIVISDSDSDEEVHNSSANSSAPLSWMEASMKLLLMAESELRNDEQAMETLLRDLNIPPSAGVRRSLQVVCEQLSELLVLSSGHQRRHRACNDLVAVVCEVLSLAQTAPVSAQLTIAAQVKEEDGGDAVHNLLYGVVQIMERWCYLINKWAKSGVGKDVAFSKAMSRLEALSRLCDERINQIQTDISSHEVEKEEVAAQWKDAMDKFRTLLQLSSQYTDIPPGDSVVLAFNSTLKLNEGMIEKHSTHNKNLIILLGKKKEVVARKRFYQAVLQLACAVRELTGLSNQVEQEMGCPPDKQKFLQNELLELVHILFDILREAMVSNQFREQVCFCKQFMLFWLIHRNQLPPVVMEIVSSNFDTLSKTKDPSKCFSDAVGSVCSGLQRAL
ncbi:unnamed protein product [Phytophthora lilii]|uniref:Unnamed protein product n=1 Tax=Phytophthora lilii TaxID=2077276 RepID=A0A9W6TCD1_9STRA|nr:unnamed protein product [Phytophthora lilii]